MWLKSFPFFPTNRGQSPLQIRVREAESKTNRNVFSKLPSLWQLKLLTWWKEITQFHTNNKTHAVQTSGRNLLKQIEPKTKWWLRGVCWGNSFCKPIFRFLFAEITFNSHILTQIYEPFCIILSLLPYDNRKYITVWGSFEKKNRLSAS